MKQVIVFLCFLMLGGVAMAQAPAHLKGPAAKNYKYWQDKDKKADDGSTLVAHDNKPQLTGPAAKNRKAWKKTGNLEFHTVKTTERPKDLMGPRYKNLKHFDRVRAVDPDVAKDIPKKPGGTVGSGEE